MELAGAIERLERTVRVCGSPDASSGELREALRATTQLEGFIAARRAELVAALDAVPAAFPEAAIADTSGCSLGQASKEKKRADTLGAASAMAEALSAGSITTGHVDALTRAAANLDADGRSGLLGLDIELAATAATSSVAEFDRFVKDKAKGLDATSGEDRLDRQRRAARARHWVDAEGMWNLRARLAPDAGVDVARVLDAATDRLRGGETPDTAPTDPLERDAHLRALALTELLCDHGSTAAGSATSAASASPAGRVRPGPPIVVVDATQATPAGGPVLDWGYPVELPDRVLRDLWGVVDPDVVVVANGVVLHAQGRLDLGRSTRLASRTQRRALAGLYSTCAVPGCTVQYDRCRLHHVIWWSDGGRTDLDNLLPVCQHHHTRLHDDRWRISLGPQRELTIRLPDGQIMSTGPPERSAA